MNEWVINEWDVQPGSELHCDLPGDAVPDQEGHRDPRGDRRPAEDVFRVPVRQAVRHARRPGLRGQETRTLYFHWMIV